jgi:hypothetical protein
MASLGAVTQGDRNATSGMDAMSMSDLHSK